MPGPRKNLTPLDMKMMGLAFNQGGVINFLGKQPEVTAPVRAQSHADSPPVQLAYITDAEKDLLVNANIHGSMAGKPNPGPAGLPSLDDFFNIPGGGIGGGSTSNTGGSVGGGGGGSSAEDYGIGAGQAVGGSDSGTVFVPTGGAPNDQSQGGFTQADAATQEAALLQSQIAQEKAAVEAAKAALAQTGAEQAETLTDTLLGRIKTKIMGGAEDGNLDLTPDFKDTLPAGMHPLRKQYEYLKEKYGDNWTKTTQAKVLEGYLSGVPVERGGGLGARDDTYGGGPYGLDEDGNPIDPESDKFLAAEKFRQQLLDSMGLAGSDIGGMNTMGTVAEQLGALSDTDYNKLRYGLSPEQFFNFNQQLMAADPSAGNEAYKAARPFSSGAGISTLFEKFAPMPLKVLAGFLPERDLSGFENYADYEKVGAGFRPLPAVEQSNMQDMSRPIRPAYKFPDADLGIPTPVYPRYPLPGDSKRPPFRPPFMPGTGIETVFNPMFLGPSFRGSPYKNRGVSPAFYEALSRFA